MPLPPPESGDRMVPMWEAVCELKDPGTTGATPYMLCVLRVSPPERGDLVWPDDKERPPLECGAMMTEPPRCWASAVLTFMPLMSIDRMSLRDTPAPSPVLYAGALSELSLPPPLLLNGAGGRMVEEPTVHMQYICAWMDIWLCIDNIYATTWRARQKIYIYIYII